jgi:cytochrome c peroxidase
MRNTGLVLGSVAVAALLAAAARTTPVVAEATEAPNKDALVELGRRLFMDPTASREGRFSCASCHDPERGFSDPRPKSEDDAGETRRHSQPLVDLGGDGFHWDGEFSTVRELLVARVAPAAEASRARTDRVNKRLAEARKSDQPTSDFRPNLPYYGEDRRFGPPATPVAERLAEDGRYAEAFAAAFGAPQPTTERVLDAMDAYCASIRSAGNAFDRFRAGDEAALSAPAKRGLALFEGKAGCAKCHLTDGVGRAPLTDGKFHDTGVSTRASIRELQFPTGAKKADGRLDPAPADLGRGETTLLRRDERQFKTPSLRDVALRAPYMHDGSFGTLAEVVRYYSEGGTPHPGLDDAVTPLRLADAEAADLVAFLRSLTGDCRAGLGFAPPGAEPLRVKLVDLLGRPMQRFTFSVEPSGDRLLGDPRESPVLVTTDARGEAEIVRPLATHVRLTSSTHEIGWSRLIPDTCASQTLVVTPRTKISLVLRRGAGSPAFPEAVRAYLEEGGAGESKPVALLRRVRALGPDEVLYAGDASHGPPRSVSLKLSSGGWMHATLPLGGGAGEPLYLGR